MGIEYGLGECSGLEQREAQNNRVCCYREQRGVNVCGDNHVVNQHSVDADAYHDEEALKCQSEQALEIVRADAAPFAVAHRSNGDRRNAHGAINLNHSTIENDRNENGHDLEAKADQQCLYRQAEKFSDAHCFHSDAHLIKSGLDVNACAAVYYSGCSCNDILTDVKYRHHNVKGVGHEVDRHGCFEKPLEEHPCVHIVHIVFLCDHGDQLVTQDKGDDDTGNGDYHIFGQPPDHVVDAAVPSRGSSADFRSYRAYLVIDIGEHIGQVTFNPPDKQFFYRLFDFFKNTAQFFTTFRLAGIAEIRTVSRATGLA